MGIQADALFSKTQQRVLAFLFDQPEKAFYLKEITDWANSGIGTVQRELSKLEEADGIVRLTHVKRKNPNSLSNLMQ